jgi:hypothetical protein
MLKRIVVYIYFYLVGVGKIAKEQIFCRQRKLQKKGKGPGQLLGRGDFLSFFSESTAP